MITPIFRIQQDADHLQLTIRAPLAKVSETEVSIEGTEVVFSSRPYFLRLYLSGEVAGEEPDSARYESDSGLFVFSLAKKTPGEVFSGLELLTRLLTPPGASHVPDFAVVCPADDESEVLEASADSVLGDYGYGFASRKFGIFKKLQEEISEIVSIRNPDEMSVPEREKFAEEEVSLKFSEDHYLADLDCESFESLWDRKSWWTEEEMSFEERERLKELPRRQWRLKEEESVPVLATLVELLFAYVYDWVTTDGEHNVESGWTIAKLSQTLSCLCRPASARVAVLSSLRRSLAYPLYRNWDLSLSCLADVVAILRAGRLRVLKCLLAIHKIFSTSGDYFYIFNELYIVNYCLWLQYVKEDTLLKFSESLDLSVSKEEACLNLVDLEFVARMAELSVTDRSGLDSDDDPND